MYQNFEDLQELSSIVGIRMTENNFNQSAASAAQIVIAEVETIVPAGELDPNQVHTAGCFVDYLVQAHTTVEELGSSASVEGSLKRVL